MTNPDLTVSTPIALGTIRKNATEEVRFTAKAFTGREIINARVWYRDADCKLRPRKQGLGFRLELLGEVPEELGKAHKAMLQ